MKEDIESYASLVGGEQMDKSWFPGLTLRQKFIGMIACSLLGFLINVLSYIMLFAGKTDRKVIAYAVLYTAGNLITIMGTCFLWGFKAQFRAITHKKRILISSIYFGSMILTIIVAFKVEDPKRKLLLIILLIVQYLSYIWYTLSFIPFARTALRACFRGATA